VPINWKNYFYTIAHIYKNQNSLFSICSKNDLRILGKLQQRFQNLNYAEIERELRKDKNAIKNLDKYIASSTKSKKYNSRALTDYRLALQNYIGYFTFVGIIQINNERNNRKLNAVNLNCFTKHDKVILNSEIFK
jgi:soluble cytochrome b562